MSYGHTFGNNPYTQALAARSYEAGPLLDLEQDPQEKLGPIGLSAWSLGVASLFMHVYSGQLGLTWVPQAATVGAAVPWLIVDVLGKRSGIRIHTPIVIFLVFMIWLAATSTVMAAPLKLTSEASLSLLKMIASAVLAANVVRRAGQFIPLFLAAAVSPPLLTLLFRDKLSDMSLVIELGIEGDMVRLGEGFGDANNLSFQACLGLIGCVGLCLMLRGRLLRVACLLPIPATLFYMTRLGSRTGMTLVVVGVVLFWFFYIRDVARHRANVKVLGLVFLVVMVAATLAWIVTSPFAYRFTDAGADYKEGRMAIALAGLSMAARSPVLGYGYYGYATEAAKMGFVMLTSHNVPVDMLVAGGIPAFLLWYGASYLPFVCHWRLRKLPLSPQDRICVNLALVGMVLYHLFSLTQPSTTTRTYWVFLGACIGYGYALRDRFASRAPDSVDEGERLQTAWLG
ncbi:MAG: O-antigen ligase family protein [Phycisphaerae bacterium]|nr:O-antigen ligase family protein [Phycisphaerae bacterium]